MNNLRHKRALLLAASMVIITAASTRLNADTGTCGGASVTLPFTDVPSSNIFFCSIAEAFSSGLTNGTTGTTYSPGDPVPREQMAAFVSRTMDQSVKRASRRAVLDQFWTNQGASNLTLTTVGGFPLIVKSDGADLWVTNNTSSSVSRVRGSDGRVLETWTGAGTPEGILIATGKIFIATNSTPGELYEIDPTQPAGAVTPLTNHLGGNPFVMAFDGQRIWTANIASVSIVTLNPLSVTNITSGFSRPGGVIYDGANIWVTDTGGSIGRLKKLDSAGNVLMTIIVGTSPTFPVFDGTNIWVPNFTSNDISVVRAAGALAGTVLATLTGNGLKHPLQAAFDGERVMVTNYDGDSVSLWRASDLVPIGTFSTGAGSNPFGVCSDGLNFWIALRGTGKVARF